MKSKLFISLLFLLILVYSWWFIPGPKVAIDYPFISKSFLEHYFNLPFVWTEAGAEGLGQYAAFFLWGWPLSFLVSLGAILGFNFVFLERIVYLLPILILGTVGIWKLGKELHFSNLSCLISSFFYLTNTYMLLLIDGGQLAIALAFVWFPTCFLLVKKSTEKGLKYKIYAGLAVTILGFFDIRFVYILGLLSLMFFLYQLLFIEKKYLISFFIVWIKAILSLSFIFLGLNFYWLYLFLMVPATTNSYQYFTQTSSTSFVNLGNSLLTLSPHWYINVFGKITALKFEFILIPLLVFLAPLLKPKNRDVGFWLIVAIVSIFLSKGTAEPFPQLYVWFFDHLPGFSLFRDSTKFFFLVMLSYSVLLGISVDEVTRRLGKNMKLVFLFSFLIVIYLLFLVRPVILGGMTGTFSIPILQNEYSSLARLFENDKTFGRIFWIPHFADLGYADSNHPRVEASLAVQKRPFAIETIGAYEVFNFLRNSPYMGEIFDISGIAYIVYPPLNPRRDDMHPDNIKYYQTFADQLSKRPWISKMTDSAIPLFKTKQHQDRFFITPNIWWVFGSEDILEEATKSASLKLSKNSIIFAEEYQALSKRLDELPNVKIVLNNKTTLDFAANFIDSSNLIFPSKNLDFNPNKSGWWKRGTGDLIIWRDFLQSKYNIDNQDFDLGGGWAVGEGSLSLNIQSDKFKKGKILLGRVMESTKSGELSFYQEDNLIGQINTMTPGNNVRWFEIGSLVSNDKTIKVISSGDINVINALAIVDRQEWLKILDKIKQYEDLDKIQNFDSRNTQETQATVTYHQIDPTSYKISVRGLSQPSFLVFSQTYNDLWKLNSQRGFPIYSLLNGYKIERDGDYFIEFEAQKYVIPGLIVSGIALASLLLLLKKVSKET